MTPEFEIDLSGVNLNEPYVRLEEQDLRILKGILSDEKYGRDFLSKYDERVFIGEAKTFARAIVDYYSAYKKLPTQRTLIECNEDQADKFNYIYDRLNEQEFDSREFVYDLDKLKNRYAVNRTRDIKEALEDALSRDKNIIEVIKDVKYSCNDIEQIKTGERKAYTQKTLKEYIPEFRRNFVNKLKNPEAGRGIMSGFSYLDYVTDGFHGGEEIIIGGESGSGKSQMLHNIGVNIWMGCNSIYTDVENIIPGTDILYFSLEMPFEVIVRRIMARLSQLAVYNIRNAKISKDEIGNLNTAAKFIRDYISNIEVVDSPRGTTVDYIEERYKESISEGRNPKVVIVDYLGLMEDDSGYNEDWLKLGYIAGKLHEFSRVYDLVSVTAVQLNRAPNKVNADSSELIGLHRIGRSSLIMTHANIGIQIESRKEEHTYSDLIYHIIKNRDGELGRHTLAKNFQCATLTDLENYVSSSNYETQNVFMGDDDISERLKEIGWFDS